MSITIVRNNRRGTLDLTLQDSCLRHIIQVYATFGYAVVQSTSIAMIRATNAIPAHAQDLVADDMMLLPILKTSPHCKRYSKCLMRSVCVLRQNCLARPATAVP